MNKENKESFAACHEAIRDLAKENQVLRANLKDSQDKIDILFEGQLFTYKKVRKVERRVFKLECYSDTDASTEKHYQVELT